MGYAIDLNLLGKKAVVVGLGSVGRRKARGLVEAGAEVLGIDPAELDKIPEVSHLREPFRSEHLHGAQLVFAAATVGVNRTVVREAKTQGIWVNSASEPELGDFRLPAVWRGGRAQIAVTTLGAGPAFSGLLRDIAAKAIGPEVEAMAELLAEIRPQVLMRVSDPGVRRRLFLSWASPDWLARVRIEGPDAVRKALQFELENVGADSDFPGRPS